jgi:hypothetical protein
VFLSWFLLSSLQSFGGLQRLAASWGLAGKVVSLQESVGSEGARRAALVLMLVVTAELWQLIV